ncbi:MAG: hypothetical protein ACREGD_03355 [Candidatus Saccharimonadales bacterium]
MNQQKARQKALKEAGIVHILAVVLTVLAVAAIAFGGWWVWENKDTSDNPHEKSNGVEKTNEKQEGQYVIPEGWQLYKNETAGFSFYYPSEWGSVQGTDSLRFSSNQVLRFQANQRNKAHTQGHFGELQFNNAIDASIEDGSARVSFLDSVGQPKNQYAFNKYEVIKLLSNSKVCVLDEVSVYEAYMDDSEIINHYVYFGYCGLLNPSFGAVAFMTDSLDITQPQTNKQKEDIVKLLQTFDTF